MYLTDELVAETEAFSGNSNDRVQAAIGFRRISADQVQVEVRILNLNRLLGRTSWGGRACVRNPLVDLEETGTERRRWAAVWEKFGLVIAAPHYDCHRAPSEHVGQPNCFRLHCLAECTQVHHPRNPNQWTDLCSTNQRVKLPRRFPAIR